MRKIRIGSRGSRLALWQTDFVIRMIICGQDFYLYPPLVQVQGLFYYQVQDLLGFLGVSVQVQHILAPSRINQVIHAEAGYFLLLYDIQDTRQVHLVDPVNGKSDPGLNSLIDTGSDAPQGLFKSPLLAAESVMGGR